MPDYDDEPAIKDFPKMDRDDLETYARQLAERILATERATVVTSAPNWSSALSDAILLAHCVKVLVEGDP
jgi:hypothetical protein